MPRRPTPPRDPAAEATDTLYRAPFDAFVDERKRLATTLKREGHPEASVRLAALAKPSASAWAVNQVYWQARATWDDLLDAGDRLRTLQQRMLGGQAADLRDATADRQKAVHKALERAMAALRESGNAATEATRQRVAVTFDAIAAYGSHTDKYTPGRLATDLDPPGFAALMALDVPALRLVKGSGTAPTQERVAPRPASPPAPGPLDPKAAAAAKKEEARLAREREDEARRVLAERKGAVAAADREVAGIQAEVDRVARDASAAQERVAEVGRDVERARKALAESEARHAEAQASAVAAHAARDAAHARLDEARRAAREARAALERP